MNKDQHRNSMNIQEDDQNYLNIGLTITVVATQATDKIFLKLNSYMDVTKISIN